MTTGKKPPGKARVSDIFSTVTRPQVSAAGIEMAKALISDKRAFKIFLKDPQKAMKFLEALHATPGGDVPAYEILALEGVVVNMCQQGLPNDVVTLMEAAPPQYQAKMLNVADVPAALREAGYRDFVWDVIKDLPKSDQQDILTREGNIPALKGYDSPTRQMEEIIDMVATFSPDAQVKILASYENAVFFDKIYCARQVVKQLMEKLPVSHQVQIMTSPGVLNAVVGLGSTQDYRIEFLRDFLNMIEKAEPAHQADILTTRGVVAAFHCGTIREGQERIMKLIEAATPERQARILRFEDNVAALSDKRGFAENVSPFAARIMKMVAAATPERRAEILTHVDVMYHMADNGFGGQIVTFIGAATPRQQARIVAAYKENPPWVCGKQDLKLYVLLSCLSGLASKMSGTDAEPHPAP